MLENRDSLRPGPSSKPLKASRPGARLMGLTLVSAIVVVDGFDTQVLGFAMPLILRDWNLGKMAMAPVLAIGLVGMTIGSLIAGFLGDRIGQRAVLLGSVGLFGAVTTVTAFARDIDTLLILRFVAGLGLGGALPNAVTLISELAPRRFQYVAVSFAMVCIPLGGALAGVVATIVLSSAGWQGMFVVGGVLPMFLGGLAYFLLPRSAAFGEAFESGKQVKQEPFAAGRQDHPLGSAFRRETVSLSLVCFCCLLAAYSAFGWLPTLLDQAGAGLQVASQGLLAYNAGGVAAAIAGGWMARRAGSKITLLGLIAMGLLAAVLLISFEFSANSHVGLFVMLIALGAATSGGQSVLLALVTHVYPSQIRASGTGIVLSIGRIGGIAGMFVGAWFLTKLGVAGFFTMHAAALTMAFFGLLLIRRHTPGTSFGRARRIVG